MGLLALKRTSRSAATGSDAGTVSQATTAGTAAESEADEPPIRFRGDEPELYLEFNHQLVKMLSAAVRAAPEDVEDAASFAWVQFFRHQPDRDGQWKGWLFRTAQRESWRLTAEHRKTSRRIVSEPERRGPGLSASHSTRRAVVAAGRKLGAV